MGVADLPLLGQIHGRLTWLDERQRLIAQNVANSDTPGYVGRDLRAPTDFAAAMREGGGLQMAQTRPGHMPVGGPSGAPVARFTSEAAPDSETTLDGNAVVDAYTHRGLQVKITASQAQAKSANLVKAFHKVLEPERRG